MDGVETKVRTYPTPPLYNIMSPIVIVEGQTDTPPPWRRRSKTRRCPVYIPGHDPAPQLHDRRPATPAVDQRPHVARDKLRHQVTDHTKRDFGGRRSLARGPCTSTWLRAVLRASDGQPGGILPLRGVTRLGCLLGATFGGNCPPIGSKRLRPVRWVVLRSACAVMARLAIKHISTTIYKTYVYRRVEKAVKIDSFLLSTVFLFRKIFHNRNTVSFNDTTRQLINESWLPDC